MLKIYNTLTRKKEEFKPIEDKKVRFYQCGPTVYWIQHLGNMRAMVLADLIRRSLVYLGYEVNFVRNYTDVGHLISDEDTGEDKMERAARNMLYYKCYNCHKIVPSFLSISRESFKTVTLIDNKYRCPLCGKWNTLPDKSSYFYQEPKAKTPQEIAEKYIKVFEDDIHDLNVADPDLKPRATENILEIIDMVKILLEKGYAYATDLAIYFDVAKAKDYTRLSGQILEKNLAQAGKGEVEDPEKRNPADFAVWFFKAGVHKNALQTWPSPFQSPLVKKGQGFPGWHIECSAMSKKYLGNTLDLHMGGIDHIPVHHTNEIAQSEAANGVKFVNYWLHNEHLIAKSERISKSAGIEKAGDAPPEYCLGTLKEKGYDPLALRYFFLTSHYRSKQNFTWEALKSAETSLNKLRDKISNFKSIRQAQDKLQISKEKEGIDGKKGEEEKRYRDKFISAIEDDLNIPQALAIMWEIIKSDLSENEKLNLIFNFDKVFGLGLESVKKEEIIIPDEVKELIDEREDARKKKDWVKSDELRKKIFKMGFVVEDTSGGAVVRKK